MEDSLDLSIGLSSALQFLAEYGQSGILQAEKLRIPRIRGFCTAKIQIAAGSVVSCLIQNRNGEYQSVSKSLLIQLDNEKGPFEWHFYPERQQLQKQPQTQIVPYSLSQPPQYPPELLPDAVPRAIANLNLDWLNTWPPQQKRSLRMVYSMVNGQRTVMSIEKSVPLPRNIVQQALLILIELQVVAVDVYVRHDIDK